MGEQPYNAGQSVTVEQVSPMPVKDVNWGPITVTENWGRLFIRWNGQEIIAVMHHYPKLLAAIQHFIPPALDAAAVPADHFAGDAQAVDYDQEAEEALSDRHAAYLAGWEASGEGYNHECGGPDKPLEDKEWLAARDAALREDQMKDSPQYAAIQTQGWRWAGMGYRDNGDGYGKFKNDVTGQGARIGAGEAGWNPKTETYKAACVRAFAARLGVSV